MCVIILFAGCNIPTYGSTEQGPEDATQDALDDWAENQLEGTEGSDKIPQDVIDAAEEWVDSVLEDPTATPQEILNVLELLEKTGLDPDSEQALMDKLKKYFEDKINNHEYCKEELTDLAAECELLGFNDLREIVSNREKSSASCESKVTRVYHYESTESSSKTDFSISARGVLRETSLMGISNGEFYFDRGVIDWEYADEYRDNCLIVRKIGGGSENLTGYNDGSFGVSSDGSYGGAIINKDVTLKVEEIKVPAPERNPDDPFADTTDYCEGVESRIYEEQGYIEIQIWGDSSDLRHLTGKIEERGNPTDSNFNSEMGVTRSDVTEWDLQINYLVDEIS